MSFLPNTRFRSTALLLLAVATSAAGGYVIGRYSNTKDISAPVRSLTLASTEKPAPLPAAPAANEIQTCPDSNDSAPIRTRGTHGFARRSDALQALASRDPRAALSLLESETNEYTRDLLRSALLRGWVTIAPDDALAWAEAQPLAIRASAISTLLESAAETDPSIALRLTSSALSRDPAMANRYVSSLIQSLVAVGEFETAARFIFPGSPEWESRLSTCYRNWALFSPEEALESVNRIDDSDTKSVALQNVVASWAVAQPEKALAYVATLPEGKPRSEGFTTVLQQWAARDPFAMLTWIDAHPPSADTRDAASAVATLPQLSPQTALAWTDLIDDQATRANARELAVFRWATQDPQAARRYVESSPALSAEERVRLTLQLSSGGSS